MIVGPVDPEELPTPRLLRLGKTVAGISSAKKMGAANRQRR